MPDGIERLSKYPEPQEIISRINEIIDAINEIRNPAPPDPLTPIQRLWVTQIGSRESTIQEVLDEWNVNFYDDVEPKFESPVYCRNCLYRSQSLLDRMLLDPTKPCDGCIHKSKFG